MRLVVKSSLLISCLWKWFSKAAGLNFAVLLWWMHLSPRPQVAFTFQRKVLYNANIRDITIAGAVKASSIAWKAVSSAPVFFVWRFTWFNLLINRGYNLHVYRFWWSDALTGNLYYVAYMWRRKVQISFKEVLWLESLKNSCFFEWSYSFVSL